MDVDFSRLFIAIAVMVIMFSAFAWGLSFWAKKRGITPQKGPRKLKLVETLFVDARTKICIIEQENEQLTLAIGQNGTTLINKKKTTTEHE